MACPTCSEEGGYYDGPAHIEKLHFFRRAVWDLHRLRRALEADNRPALAHAVSVVIRQLEAVGAPLLNGRHVL
jgi:hypothetical protein